MKDDDVDLKILIKELPIISTWFSTISPRSQRVSLAFPWTAILTIIGF